jgi:L-pipecolate oxidase
MNNDPRSHGLWEASAVSAPELTALKDSITTEVVVVGAGFTGLSAALHLAELGKNVVVLESHEVGFGGSGRNVGLVNAGLWITPYNILRTLGEQFGSRVIRQLGAAPSLVFDLVSRYGMKCEAVRNGTLHCAVGRTGLRNITQRAEQWKGLGAPVTLLSGPETARKVGTDAFSGSLLDTRAGTIQPLGYARELARASLSIGATIYTSSPVESIEDLGNAWKLYTPLASVTAPWVIVATNDYSQHVWKTLTRELTRLPYFNVSTRPLPDALGGAILPERQGLWDSRKVLSSLRVDASGRVIFGGVGAMRGSAIEVHKNWARRALLKLFPHLQGVDFEHEWFGWIGMTNDAVPRFHRLARNTVSISGYNGRGIAPGTAFGRELAMLAVGQLEEGDMSLPVTQLGESPLRRIKEAFYEIGSRALHAVEARF